MSKVALIPVILAIGILLLAGCGGGGDSISLSGTVTDVAGNLIPGAQIYVDGHAVTTSLMNGTYKVSGISSGYHNVEAVAEIDGDDWIGTRAVDVFSSGPTMNMNIVIGHYNILGNIEGSVKNVANDPLPNARVIAVARYPQPEDRPADEASVVSKVAVTDANGNYVIEDLPANITVNGEVEEILYDVIASFAGETGEPGGYENVIKTAVVAGGMATTLNFTLTPSDDETVTVPPGWTDPDAIYVISYTVPKAITSRAEQSAYDAIKSCISERSRKAIALKQKAARRSPPPGTLIENNVVWYSIWLGYFGIDPPSNLAGFTIYRGSTSNLTKTDRFRLDFFRDPSIVTYADASSELSAGQTYWYGVTAVSTSYLDANDNFNPDAESAMCEPASVTPLGKIVAATPNDNATVNISNPRFTWLQLASAESYKVFIYEDYPILDAMFTPEGDPARPDHLPAWGESDTVTGSSVIFDDPDFTLSHGHTYWWIVMASDNSDFDFANAYAISELRSFVAQ